MQMATGPDVLVTAEIITELRARTPDLILCEPPVPQHNKACCFSKLQWQMWLRLQNKNEYVESLEKQSVSAGDQSWLARKTRFKSLQFFQFEPH